MPTYLIMHLDQAVGKITSEEGNLRENIKEKFSESDGDQNMMVQAYELVSSSPKATVIIKK